MRKPCWQPGACPETCWPAWCALLAVPRHAVRPRHAGQPGARAEACWPAWCSCQMLASLVLVPGARAKTCWPRLGNVFVASLGARQACLGMLASLLFVPKQANLCSRPGTWHQPGVRTSVPGHDVQPRQDGGASRAKFVPRHAGVLYQDMLASLVSLALVPRHAGQPGARMQASLVLLASLVLVPKHDGCLPSAGLPGAPRHAGQRGGLCLDMLVSLVLVPCRPETCWLASCSCQDWCSCQDILAGSCSCQDMLASLGARAKTCSVVPGHAGQLGVHKTCWPAWCSCQDMLASLARMVLNMLAAWCWCQDMLVSLVLAPRHAGRPACSCRDIRPFWPL